MNDDEKNDDGTLIRNHPSTAGLWNPSDELQDLTRPEQAPEDSCPPDEDPPREGYADVAGDPPTAICVDCVHCYDVRPPWRLWLDRLLLRPLSTQSLFCRASPRESVYSPLNGAVVYLNGMFNTPSRSLAEPHERCQEVNLWGQCPLFKEPK